MGLKRGLGRSLRGVVAGRVDAGTGRKRMGQRGGSGALLNFRVGSTQPYRFELSTI